jgi:hypothetical protein
VKCLKMEGPVFDLNEVIKILYNPIIHIWVFLNNGKKNLLLILPTLKWVLHVIEIKGLHKRSMCYKVQSNDILLNI